MHRVLLTLWGILFFIIAFELGAEGLRLYSKMPDGERWENWDNEKKYSYVEGFIAGIRVAEKCIIKLHPYLQTPHDTALFCIYRALVTFPMRSSLWVVSLTVSKIDSFYMEDYRNLPVLVSDAIEIAQSRIAGNPKDKIEERIRIIRLSTQRRKIEEEIQEYERLYEDTLSTEQLEKLIKKLFNE